jgi:hypothetical protein
VPALLAGLKSDDQFLRITVIDTLADAGPNAKAALPALREFAKTEPIPGLRERLARAVKQIEGNK